MDEKLAELIAEITEENRHPEFPDERQRRGRPGDRLGTAITVRLQPALLDKLDEMCQADPTRPTRAEMLRRLLEDKE